ncbi:MAG: hypothetical protein U5R06_17395 [candidate division KSB1 bacterium]|nr:hypothetical protein [candidate division KSB1 bacterium]
MVYVVQLRAGELQSVFATQIRPVRPAAYIFNIQFDAPVTATSQIEIRFAEQFTLLQNIIVSSDDLAGGLQAVVEKQKLIITRVKPAGSVEAGEALEIRTASVVNPVDMEQPYEFQISLLNGNTIADSMTNSVNIELFTNQKLQ